MFLYIASHAQSMSGKDTLSALGQKQARLLGEHLKAQGFGGKILCAESPCVMQTASILSGVLGLPFEGLSLLDAKGDELSKLTHVRAIHAYKDAISRYPDVDLLLLSDADTCEALIDIFTTVRRLNTRQYDCALSTIRPTRYIAPVLYDTSFLAYEDTTYGALSREECDVAHMLGDHGREISLPDLSQLKGERVLHIGDTESAAYPYYRELIRLVRPDVILHTGDLADEVKIGRHPEFLHEYTVKVSHLLSIMRESGARVVIVPGNHDVRDVIEKLAPYAEIYENGSEILLSDIPCRVGHQVKEMTFDRRYCMYGHGAAGEVWRDALNLPGESCRFNAAFGDYVYDLKNDRYVRLSPVRGLLK